MTRTSAAMPSFSVATAALRETTETLAAEVVDSGTAAPEWDELNWAIARAAATIQGISSLLGARLRWTGPPAWLSFLVAQERHSARRDRRIGELLERVDAVTRDAQIRVVALKGAALRSLSIYRSGERPMADIDLLVQAADLPRLQRALGKLSYDLAYSSLRHAVFLQSKESVVHGFGEHEHNAVPIEVHTAVAESMPVCRIDITDSLWPKVAHDGINAHVSRADLMLHLLLHSSANIRKRAIRQIQLHDIALLAQSLDADQWSALLRGRDNDHSRWWIYPPLLLTERYYTGSIPDDVLAAARGLCPPALRILIRRARLADVSFANPHIPAFPGIGWSRTPLEALRFMISRIAPDRAALEGLRKSVATNRQLRRLPWYELSHIERIVRWASGRAPRVQTLISVNAALEQAAAETARDR